ncbi:hypothetical protein JL722_9609 [Aureococcus anophagefferens]|nr:hypothetical protein JL722_9609 [Aureococcus anophagefferens]
MERMSSMDIGSLPDSTWGDIVEQGGLGISFDESPDTVLLTTPGEGGGIAAQLSAARRRCGAELEPGHVLRRPAAGPLDAPAPVVSRQRGGHRRGPGPLPQHGGADKAPVQKLLRNSLAAALDASPDPMQHLGDDLQNLMSLDDMGGGNFGERGSLTRGRADSGGLARFSFGLGDLSYNGAGGAGSAGARRPSVGDLDAGSFPRGSLRGSSLLELRDSAFSFGDEAISHAAALAAGESYTHSAGEHWDFGASDGAGGPPPPPLFGDDISDEALGRVDWGDNEGGFEWSWTAS